MISIEDVIVKRTMVQIKRLDNRGFRDMPHYEFRRPMHSDRLPADGSQGNYWRENTTYGRGLSKVHTPYQ